MYAGAVLSALSFIVGLATLGSLRQAIINASNKPLTATQLHAAEVAGVVVIVLAGLVGVSAWLWMAWKNGRGRSWARIVATVLFGLDTLSLLSAIFRPNTGGTKIIGLLIWLVGLGATIYLWRPDANLYFKQSESFK